MENRIFNDINVLKLLTKFTTQRKTIIRFGLIVFLFKSLNAFNLSAATKNLRTNYTFFVKSICFLLVREQEGNGKFLKSTLTISNKYWHSVNLRYYKIHTRSVFTTQSNFYNKSFL